jgi:peroxiredoxin
MVTQKSHSLTVLAFLLAGILVSASMAIALEVGEQAPDFTLPSTMGASISLSQFRGKKLVLLEFYGVDFAPT